MKWSVHITKLKFILKMKKQSNFNSLEGSSYSAAILEGSDNITPLPALSFRANEINNRTNKNRYHHINVLIPGFSDYLKLDLFRKREPLKKDNGYLLKRQA